MKGAGVLMALCGLAVPLAGCVTSSTSIEFDGRPVPITSTCTIQPGRTCTDSLEQPRSYSVTCNAKDPLDHPAIYVTLQFPEQFQITAIDVVWLHAKSDTPEVNGGVRNFQADRGADVEATLPHYDGMHRFVARIRC